MSASAALTSVLKRNVEAPVVATLGRSAVNGQGEFHPADGPTLIIGAHRSGTSLLAQTLSEGGVFLGADASTAHCESRFFLRTNKALLKMAHADWDFPGPTRLLASDLDARPAVVAFLRHQLRSWRVLGYAGVWPKTSYRPGRPWGWKDPRTSVTLPFWLEVYPTARVISVHRHGVDVALSLWRREQQRHDALSPRASTRCRRLDGAFALWVEYEEMIDEVLHAVPPDRVLRVRFEDVVTRSDALAQMTDFAHCSRRSATRVATSFDRQRVFAFRDDTAGRDLFGRVRAHAALRRWGYDDTASAV